MARIQAKWGAAKFSQHLAQVDPLVFYLAILQAILSQDESEQQFHHNLLSEKEWLVETGRWPANPLNLETLLAPLAA